MRKHPLDLIMENSKHASEKGHLAIVAKCSAALVRVAELHAQYYEATKGEKLITASALRKMSDLFLEEAKLVEDLEALAKEHGIDIGGEIPTLAGPTRFGRSPNPTFNFGVRRVKDD